MKTHKHSDGRDYDGVSCTDVCEWRNRAATLSEIITNENTDLWIPAGDEIDSWRQVATNATKTNRRQFIIVDDHVYSFTDTGLMSQQLIDAWKASKT